jgi:hypothetical protein
MIWILAICVWVLAMLCAVLGGRVHKLQNDLVFWRDEAIKLNNEKPSRGKDGRYCKK